jgi:hypothetical protein
MTPRDRSYIYLLIGLCFAVAMLAGCKPPAPPTTQSSASKPLVCVVGGLGGNQLGEIAKLVQHLYPNAVVVPFGERDAYLADLAGYIAKNPHSKLVLIAHSYGASACNDALPQIAGDVDLWLMFDPVPQRLFGTFTVPGNVKRTAVVWANPSGLIRANVKYPTAEYLIRDGHSAICKTPQAYNIVEREMAMVLK